MTEKELIVLHNSFVYHTGLKSRIELIYSDVVIRLDGMNYDVLALRTIAQWIEETFGSLDRQSRLLPKLGLVHARGNRYELGIRFSQTLGARAVKIITK